MVSTKFSFVSELPIGASKRRGPWTPAVPRGPGGGGGGGNGGADTPLMVATSATTTIAMGRTTWALPRDNRMGHSRRGGESVLWRSRYERKDEIRSVTEGGSP